MFSMRSSQRRCGRRLTSTPLLPNDRLISRLDFALSRRDSAARGVTLGDSSTIAAAVPGTASLRGLVLGGDGRPMRDAVEKLVGDAVSDFEGAYIKEADKRPLDKDGNPMLYKWAGARNIGE